MDSVSQAGLRLALPGDMLAVVVPKIPAAELRLDWAALDRAARLVARLGAAPVRQHRGNRGEAVEAESAATVDHGRETGRATDKGVSKGAGLLFASEGVTSGSIVAPIGLPAGRAVAEHDLESARRDALSRPGVNDGPTQGRMGAHAAAHKAVSAAVQDLARAKARAEPELDPGLFASLGAPPSLPRTTMATAAIQGAGVVRAAAPLPAWLAGATAASTTPAWTAPRWVAAAPGIARSGSMPDETPAWLMPSQGGPAAPHGGAATAPASEGAGQGWPSPFEQARARSPSFSSGSGTADAWPRAAGMPRAAPGDAEAGFTGFGDSEGVSRRALDEMAWLASRPPIGITGFDAGQMPAWLGGWTGGL